MFSIIQAAGWPIWPLILLSIVGLTLIIERSLMLRRGRVAPEKLLDEEAYEAACSDAHRPSDVDVVVSSIQLLERRVGREEARRLLVDGPRQILGLS